MKQRHLRRLGFVLLTLSMTLFSVAAGVFVRDLGAGDRHASSGPLDPGGVDFALFNAYELPYEVTVFTTVRVRITIEAVHGDLHLEYVANGSFITTFRPRLPGAHEVRIVNLEPIRGTVGLTILMRNTVPPDLETSILNPLLYGTAGMLIASVIAFSTARRAGGGPMDEEEV